MSLPGPKVSRRDLRRWRKALAAERAEAAIYRDLAGRRDGEERAILLALAEAECRHERHWLALLGDQAAKPAGLGLRARLLGFGARRFGSVFVLALIQNAEARSPHSHDPDARPEMAADEQVHREIVRALATQGRVKLSGSFRAAVFGANDGLVSNLSLILGIGATGVAPSVVLLTGLAGLLAGALSMAAGEYVSVRSQRELLEASTPSPDLGASIRDLDIDANELTLLYRSRGMSQAAAQAQAAEVMGGRRAEVSRAPEAHEAVGTAWTAALSSFGFFAAGALIPVLPYLAGLSGLAAIVVSAGVVGLALLLTGGTVGLLSGAPPLRRALRQLAIGYGAAAVTYALGSIFGAVVG